MSRLFITGTGTGVGKTWVAAALTRQLKAAGKRARASKPLVSGFDPDFPEGSDPAVLLEACGEEPSPEALARMSPLRFFAALSPDMAAAREGKKIDVATLSGLCAADDDEVLIIEGVGGVAVPLNPEETTLDWMAALGAPAVLVAGAYLGTLSHTLTAARALEAAGVKLHAVVLNEREPGPVDLEETLASLRPHLGQAPVLTVPQLVEEGGWKEAPDLTSLAQGL